MSVGVGDRLGSNYVLGEVLGRGAMGVVYEARVLSSGECVAIKVLRPKLASDLEIVGRFVRERVALQRVNHRNVVKVRDLVVDAGHLGIVMERIDGLDLQKLRKDRSFSPAETLEIAGQLAAGLDDIHASRVIHRDLKPANVLLVDGDRLVPKITDFGIAHLAATRRESKARLIGTPRYIAPEALKEGAEIGPPVDIYALGVLLFEMLTGDPPFVGESTMAILQAHWRDPAPSLGGVPAALTDMVDRMLAKAPEDRPAAREVVALINEVAPSIGPDTEPTRVEPSSRAAALVARRAPTTAFVKVARLAAERRRSENNNSDVSEAKPGPGSRSDAEARIAAARAAAKGTVLEHQGGVPVGAPDPIRLRLPRWAMPAVVATLLAGVGLLALVVSSGGSGAGGGQGESGAAGANTAADLTVRTTSVQGGDEAIGPRAAVGDITSAGPTVDPSNGGSTEAFSLPTSRVRVPDLTGLSRFEAESELGRIDLGVESVDQLVASGSPLAGVVVRSEPAPGTLVDPGETITLYFGVSSR